MVVERHPEVVVPEPVAAAALVEGAVQAVAVVVALAEEAVQAVVVALRGGGRGARDGALVPTSPAS